ncbi:MAG: ATP-binding cassette domain-containing protein [Thermodesulfovibrio sp.]
MIGLIGEFTNQEMNFEIEEGSRGFFIFEKDEHGNEFLKVIAGMKKPAKGEVFLMGKRLSELSRDELFELRKKIGIVFKTGGLISNLKAWENILLPALYHKVDNEENITKRGIEIIREFELEKKIMCSVAQLTKLEKRIIGIVRALLIKPDIIIFEYPFEGLQESERRWLSEKIEKLRGGITALYILSSERERLIIENKNATS